MRTMTVGGAAPPRAMIEAFGERHGLHITHGWGMTEMCPIGTISGAPGQESGLADAGRRTTSARCKARRSRSSRSAPEATTGSSPWDGLAMGSSRCAAPRSPRRTTTPPEAADRWTDDGWFRTGDIVSHPSGRLCRDPGSREGSRQVGRRVDLDRGARERSDGASRRARGRRHRRPRRAWSERPLAVVVFREGQSADADELRAFLAPNFAKWWLPGAVRGRGRDSEDGRRQVPQDGIARAVRGAGTP